MWDNGVHQIAALGDTILSSYGLHLASGLVIYRHSVSTPGKLLPCPQELGHVRSLTTDHHSSFLVTDTTAVHVLDMVGNLTHTIPIPGDRKPVDCTVVGTQVWLACPDGVIVVMSSQ